MITSLSPVRFAPLSVDADGDSIPDAPAAATQAAPTAAETVVISGTVNVQESSWWDSFVNWLIPDDAAETVGEASTSSPTLACGFFVGATAPEDDQDASTDADADVDIDADGDTIPDGDDGDDDGPEDIQPEDIQPEDVPDGEDGDVNRTCDNPPGVFNLEDPSNGSSSASLIPNFNWSDSARVDAGDSVSYTVEIDDASDFLTPLRTYSDIPDSNYLTPAPLANGTTYYWRVTARDLCSRETPSTPDYYSFTTIEFCATPPSTFALSLPGDGAASVSVTPTFDWVDSTDPDAGDSVSYRLEIDTDNTFPAPIIFNVPSGSTYTVDPADALANDTTYYWRVYAVDGCGNRVRSSNAYYSFHTEPSCIWTPYITPETDFTNPAIEKTNTVARSGSVFLAEDYDAFTYKYEANVLPGADGWTEEAPSGWTAPTPEINPAGVLHASSIGINDTARWRRNCGFDNPTGWLAEAFLDAETVESTSVFDSPLVITPRDGTRWMRLRIYTDRIEALGASTTILGSHAIGTTGYFGLRIAGQGNNIDIYLNDGFNDFTTPVISGSWMTDTTTSQDVFFGDSGVDDDSEYRMDYLYCFNGGRTLPLEISGNIIGDMIDAGLINNVGSGAVLRWAQNLPAGTATSAEVFAASTPARPSTACASGLSNNTGEVIPGTCTGQYIWWKINLFASIARDQGPEIQSVVLEHQSCE